LSWSIRTREGGDLRKKEYRVRIPIIKKKGGNKKEGERVKRVPGPIGAKMPL